MDLTPAQRTYVGEVLALAPLLSFNEGTGAFDISEPDVTWEQIGLIGPAIRTLRNTPPPPPALSSVRLADLVTGYYDRCLEHHAFQRLNESVPHAQTCWIRYAQNTFCLGRIDPDAELDQAAAIRFLTEMGRRADNPANASIAREFRRDPGLWKALRKDRDGWLMFHADIPIRSVLLRKRLKAYWKTFVNRVTRTPEEDRVLGLVRSIEAHGWSNDLARQPSGSVLGYSRKTGRYMALTGRHRIAAARYLYSQGRLAGQTRLEVPVITYPWASWLQGRPHPDTPRCDWCR